MDVPGSDILDLALSAINSTPFQYYSFKARATNAVAQYVSTYNAPLTLTGSVQAVPRNIYQVNGLDFQKNYLKLYVSKNVIDVSRDTSGDMIVYNGFNYQVLSITPWHSIDGWVEIMAVQVPNAPLIG